MQYDRSWEEVKERGEIILAGRLSIGQEVGFGAWEGDGCFCVAPPLGWINKSTSTKSALLSGPDTTLDAPAKVTPLLVGGPTSLWQSKSGSKSSSSYLPISLLFSFFGDFHIILTRYLG